MDTPLRRARVLKGLTQDQLAAKANVSKNLVSDAERGRRIGPLSKGRLATALEADYDELFPESQEASA